MSIKKLKRTPQQVAEFLNKAVARDENGEWHCFPDVPVIDSNYERWILKKNKSSKYSLTNIIDITSPRVFWNDKFWYPKSWDEPIGITVSRVSSHKGGWIKFTYSKTKVHHILCIQTGRNENSQVVFNKGITRKFLSSKELSEFEENYKRRHNVK